ncbi:MAG TPA: toll/interleukin-1 receptor domain-containing protein [Pyrinomonadaceae bacterium]|nr:toll/interleukin-1 receptor domain-containing protein [Pyrinomonadaceae bacterium]
MSNSEDLIFLSYSRKDAEFVRKLYLDLREDGFNIWFDQEEIVPGQKWQQTILEVMSDVRAVILCLSTKWTGSRGYIQNELKLALELLREFPAEAIFIVPIRLDDCEIPRTLRGLHYIDVWDEASFAKVKQHLTRAFGPLKKVYGLKRNIKVIESDETTASSKFENAGKYRAFLTGWDSDEDAIKAKFNFLNNSVDLMANQNYRAVLELWKDVEELEEFDLRHETWNRSLPFRLPLLIAKSHLLLSRLHLYNNCDDDEEMQKAFRIMQEVVEYPPFEMVGIAPDERFRDDTLDVQTQNYRDLLLFILNWFEGWSPTILKACYGIPEVESQSLLVRVDEQLAQTNKFLRSHH